MIDAQLLKFMFHYFFSILFIAIYGADSESTCSYTRWFRTVCLGLEYVRKGSAISFRALCLSSMQCIAWYMSANLISYKLISESVRVQLYVLYSTAVFYGGWFAQTWFSTAHWECTAHWHWNLSLLRSEQRWSIAAKTYTSHCHCHSTRVSWQQSPVCESYVLPQWRTLLRHRHVGSETLPVSFICRIYQAFFSIFVD